MASLAAGSSALPSRNQLQELQAASFVAMRGASEARAVLAALLEPSQQVSQRAGEIPPKIPPNWVSLLQFGDTDRLASSAGMFQRVVQEATEQRRAFLSGWKFHYAPASFVGTPLEWFNISTYETPFFSGMAINGNGMAEDTPVGNFTDLFVWVPFAQDCGETTFHGKSVHKWCLRVEKAAMNSSLAVLIDSGGLPVLLDENITVVGRNQSCTRYVFQDFQPNKVDPDVWIVFNQSSFLHPPICDAGPVQEVSSSPQTLMTTTMYVFHPESNFDIGGQDLADHAGDTVFVCVDLLEHQTNTGDHNYRWLTKWEIEHLPVWGQYENCNGYDPPSCESREHFHVGHEAAYYIGLPSALDRQCRSNPVMGEWFSLPVDGECKDGAKPGDGSCSWRKAARVKTILGECLFHGHEFRNTCAKDDSRVPFTAACSMFAAAFDSEDPSKGGCPALPGPTSSEMAFVV